MTDALKPSNVKVLNELDDEHLPDFVRVIHCSGPTVSDSLADKIRAWTPASPILIHAPTGMGKNYFIEHCLLPCIIEKGESMLLASNRIAVSVQQKRRIMQLLGDPRIEMLTDKGILAESDFGPVRIMTLQALGPFMHDEANSEWCSSCSVIVVDEAHFFTSDSSFNHNTEGILFGVAKVFRRALRVYMSATPEDLLVPLARIEENTERPMSERWAAFLGNYQPSVTQRELIVYCFAADYSNVCLRYYRRDADLFERIKESPADDRWLIHVTSIQGGMKLRDQLRKEFGDDAVTLITAESKGSKAWQELVEQERLSHRITLATSVIDCGVNIRDESLRHIVIGALDRATFIQFLGRKRRTEGDQLTLYIPEISKSTIANRRQQLDEKLEFIQIVEHGDGDARRSLFYRLWYGSGSDNDSLCTLVRPTHDCQLRINQIAAHKVRRDSYALRKLEGYAIEFGDGAFPRLVHEWLLGAPEYDEQNWLDWKYQGKLRAELLELLNIYAGKPISDESDKEKIRAAILNLDKATNGTTYRKNRCPDNGALTNILGTLEIPFEIKKNRGSWTIRKDES